MSNKLGATSLQSNLLCALRNTPRHGDRHEDVPIVTMYKEVYGHATFVEYLTVRDMQQKLGGLIARTNARLKRKGKKYKIIPGKIKQTYCIKYDK